jgi:hypothetical protein
MSGAVAIKVEGFEKIVKKFKRVPKEVIKETDGLLANVAKGFENRAVNDAPVFDGILKAGITSHRNGEMDWEVGSHAPHSAYIEFGTKSRFKAIPGIDSSRFKGKSGSGGVADLFGAILNWVKKKGIASRWSVKTHKPMKANKQDTANILEAASAITISILRHGIHPHPYFYKQLPIAQSEIQTGMKEVIQKALNS